MQTYKFYEKDPRMISYFAYCDSLKKTWLKKSEETDKTQEHSAKEYLGKRVYQMILEICKIYHLY